VDPNIDVVQSKIFLYPFLGGPLDEEIFVCSKFFYVTPKNIFYGGNLNGGNLKSAVGDAALVVFLLRPKSKPAQPIYMAQTLF
jgi:hypothetical protein